MAEYFIRLEMEPGNIPPGGKISTGFLLVMDRIISGRNKYE